MNTLSNAMPDTPLNSQTTAVSISETRPLYWSVRRELWENRSIYIAPLAAAAVYLLGDLISLIWLPQRMRELEALHPMDQRIKLAEPYAHAGMLLMLVGLIVGVFYSLDALHGERRDRSILFWKSLPVSDFTTVLSKASIPLVVLPLLVFAITVVVQLMVLLLQTSVVLVSGAAAGAPWTPPLFEMQLVLLYGLTVLALWHAPVYCWFLLVSGWAKRATFLWAVFPPLVLCALERIAFNTNYLVTLLLKDRLFGFAAAAFNLTDQNGAPIDAHLIPLAQLAPGRFLSSPGLWLGLVFAAICLVGAVRLRRYQGPI
jgi:ABC-2 type transport system permease protein